MEIREANLALIAAVKGSRDTAAAFLGMTPSALRNRAYEVKGQTLTTEHSLLLQELSGQTFFAEAVAIASGGTFVKLPKVEAANEDIGRKFRDLYAELGRYSEQFNTATADDHIDATERAALSEVGQRIHRVLAELTALTFNVYCTSAQKADAE